METEKQSRFVLETEGDGAACVIVTEAHLRQALHGRLCTCQEEWVKCGTPNIKEIIKSLDDDDEWSHPYPEYQRLKWEFRFEDGAVSVIRLAEDGVPVQDECHELHEITYDAVKNSELFNLLENWEIDIKADQLHDEVVKFIERWIDKEVNDTIWKRERAKQQ